MEGNILKSMQQQKIHQQLGIAYMSRTQIILYVQGMPNVITIPFPPDTIRDLDIIDQQKLTTLIQTAIAQQKIPPSSLTLLLANDLLFAKQMMNSDIKAQALEEQAFVDIVPYEEVAVQRIPFNKGVYITVANKDFINGIIEAFKLNHYVVPLVLAAYMFSKEVNFANPLTPQTLMVVMQKAAPLKQFNFIQKEVIMPQPLDASSSKSNESSDGNAIPKENAPPPKSNRVFVLVGIFIMLIGVLIAVYLWSSQSNQPVRQVEPTPSQQAPLTPEPTTNETSEVASGSAEVQGARDLQIVLRYPGESRPNAVLVEDSLQEKGFIEITTEEGTTSQDTTVRFNNTIPESIKNSIIAAVSRVYDKVIIQNSNTFQTPVTIELGAE
jgi:hypothetical protein